MSQSLTKNQLLGLLTTEREQWDAQLAQVGEANMTTPGVVGDWSVKDIIAHVAFWERYAAAFVRAAFTGRPPTDEERYGVAELPAETQAMEVDQFNDWTFQRQRQRPLPEILTEDQTIYRDLYTMLRGLREPDLLVEGRYDWAQGRALWEYVAGNTYEHWAEHGQSIHAWLAAATTEQLA
ncbi:MAG: ClbS/DfsB family four-helix bundle protein [Anaerolineae bacterium]|nr:ClbS/DfsB family four-helix bundle protein [Anaerolineae bacterium]